MFRVAGVPPVSETATNENVPATRVAVSVVTTIEPLPLLSPDAIQLLPPLL